MTTLAQNRDAVLADPPALVLEPALGSGNLQLVLRPTPSMASRG